MCGIVGFVGHGDQDTLIRMRDALRHRGPDAAGEYSDPTHQVFLGHRRLSIVDLSRGHQPMVSRDGEDVLVFNGEIYNHPELKSELQKSGHQYCTDCDSETILHAYREWGVDCVAQLDGMFAFVIYDRRRQRLFGARDRFGKKPFYYIASDPHASESDVQFAFASELKGLRAHRWIESRMRLSMDNVISYLLNDYVVGERCIFENVSRLAPATAFTYELGGHAKSRFHRWRFWESRPENPGNDFHLSFDEAADQLLALFEQSIRKRLMSDVPLGAFISGGIDSAAIVAMMTRILPPRKVKTFCIGFEETSFDESRYARIVADHFGTDHYERQFTAGDMLARLPTTIESMDEPFADPSILPVTMLSEFAREHVTVALGGDGGDEIFAGYDPFRAVMPATLCRRWIPTTVQSNLLRPMTELIPASDQNLSLRLKLSRFLRGLEVPAAAQAPVWMGAFSLAQLRHLLPDHCSSLTNDTAYSEATAAFAQMVAVSPDPLTATIDFFQQFYLPDDILWKVDRASMAHSLEVRCPMLDRDLCEFANRLPTSYKFAGGKTKRILRHLAQKTEGLAIPRPIIDRKKKGFGIPIGKWMRDELREPFEESLLHAWPDSLDMFNRDYIHRLYTSHVNRSADHYKELWALFVLSQWVSKSSDKSCPPSLTLSSVR